MRRERALRAVVMAGCGGQRGCGRSRRGGGGRRWIDGVAIAREKSSVEIGDGGDGGGVRSGEHTECGLARLRPVARVNERKGYAIYNGLQ